MLVLFGRTSPKKALDDAWIWSDNRWVEFKPGQGERPRPRWSHTLTRTRSSCVLVGGRDEGGYASDAWVLDCEQQMWTRVKENVSVFHHASVALDDTVMVLGGIGKTEKQPDVLVLSESRWKEVEIGEKINARRRPAFAHSAVTLSDTDILVFGGAYDEEECHSNGLPRLERLRILHSQSASTWKMTQIPVAANMRREARLFPVHAAAVALRQGLVFVIGGGVQCFAFQPIFSQSFFIEQ